MTNSTSAHWVKRIFLVMLALFVSIGFATAADQKRRVQLTENADYYGFDYKTVKDVTLDQCSSACINDQQCKAFTYNLAANWCFLKSDYGTLQDTDGATAGRISVQRAAAPVKFNELSDLKFVKRQDLRANIALRAMIAALPDNGDAGDIEIRFRAASADNDFNAMRPLIQDWVAADQLYHDAWMSYANVYWRSRSKQWRTRQDYRSKALSGSLEAYRLAQNDNQRAAALEMVALSYNLAERHRPALDAYKASLAVVDDLRVRADYEKLDAVHGFRMLDYTVDSDAVSPRICVQFSEALDNENTEYTDYVRLNGLEPADLNAKNKELCVGGLVHGEQFQISLRAGLPAKIGEKIDTAITLDIYVRDRSPNVSFSGSSYVLSRSHARGIPLKTVNLDAVNMKLYQVPDAAIAEVLRSRKFNASLSGGSVFRLEDSVAAPIWEGVLEVETRLNEDVSNLMPVFKVIGDLKPGAYMLTAEGPKTDESYWQPKATQWFVVSDIGLSSLSAEDGLHVFARSLETTRPMAGVDVKLRARSGEVLDTTVTDETGYARFAPGLLRGKGAQQASAVIAETGAPDYAFLDLDSTGFDLSDRGVDGRESPGAVDAFLYTERGIYRPGATVYATALLRDAAAEAVSGLPVTFIVRRPDGVEFARGVSTGDSTGGHAQSFRLPGNALRGAWDLHLHSDPDAAPIATKRFLVEDFIPDRIEFDVAVLDEELRAGSPASMSVDARFLFGAPASGLGVSGQVSVREQQPKEGPYRGFNFGLSDERFYPVNQSFNTGARTDEAGHGEFSITIPAVNATTKPLSAKITITMKDGGGRPVQRVLERPLASNAPSMGIRPLFDGAAPEGGSAGFQLVALDENGTQIAATNVKYQLIAIERRYQWYRKSNGLWGWEAVTHTRIAKDGRIDLDDNGFARLDLDVDWGSYRLELVSADIEPVVASYDFYAGWYVEKSAFDTPDALQIGLDKDAYSAGDVAQVRLKSERDGQLQLLIANEDLLEHHTLDVVAGEQSFEVPVGDNWGAGAYVLATLHHPMDKANGQLPSRSIGVEWLNIDASPRTLDVVMRAPEQIRPKTTISIPVKINGLSEGPAHIVVSAVDQGILNLTRYKAPQPESWYYKQRRLGATLRDLYGQLINGLDGVEGRIRVGGDDATAGLSMQGNPPAEKPVSLYSGVVDLDENGEATISLDVPQFNGTLKLMAVAWNEDKVGSAQEDIIVRDPVVITATQPRFLAPGDKSRLLIRLDNTDGPAGDYKLVVGGSSIVEFGKNATQTVTLEEGANLRRLIPVTPNAVGDADVNIALSGPDGLQISKLLTLPIRANTQPVSAIENLSLKASGGDDATLTLSDFVLKRYVPGTASLSVAIGAGAGLNPAALYSRLDRYAYRCSEQTTSRAMPLLSRGSSSDADRATIEEAIAGLVTRQNSSGAFGLWGAYGSNDLWLDSYVSDFFTRAREAGYSVPETAFLQAINNIKNRLSYGTNVETHGNLMAYALYVLARNGEATLGDLRYFADAKADNFTSVIAKAQLAAGLALYGEKIRASKIFEDAIDLYVSYYKAGELRAVSTDYGSRVRDGAALLTLVAESGLEQLDRAELSATLVKDRQSDRYLSTQELSWLLMASNAVAADAPTLDVTVSHDGETLNSDPASMSSNVLSFGFSDTELANGNVTISNKMSRTLPVVVETSGVPSVTSIARDNGYVVTRSYYNRDGTAADLNDISQNQRLVVVVSARQTTNRTDKILLVDPLPAGLEIDNPHLLSVDNTGLRWLPASSGAQFTGFMDDRFVASFNGKAFNQLPVSDGSDVTTFVYQVRAISPGTFTIPPTHVEDMYQPEIFGSTTAQTLSVIGPLE